MKKNKRSQPQKRPVSNKFHAFLNTKLTTFPAIPDNASYEEINISHNNLVSFKGLSLLPKLVTLKCNDTKITSFMGAKVLPSLKNLFLANTPISHYANYRIMAVIVFGDTLENIDFCPIKQNERLYAANNRDLLAPLLTQGWIMTVANPIKLYHVETRQRRVMFPKPGVDSAPSPGRSPRSQKSGTSNPSTPKDSPVLKKTQQTFKSEEEKSLYLLKNLHSMLFERNLTEIPNLSADFKPLLTNKETISLFVNLILRAINARPLFIREIVEFIASVGDADVAAHLREQIPVFDFNSYSISAILLENLLLYHVLTNVDVKPYFFTVYDNFDDWNSKFILFEVENKLSIDFLTFFCLFSTVIEKVDSDLFNNLFNQLGKNEKQVFDKFKAARSKRENILKALNSDDFSTLSKYNDEEISQNVLEFTPWNITASIKSAAAAFAGAYECFNYYSEEAESEETALTAIAGGNFEIMKTFKIDLSEFVETSIQFHRFDIFKEFLNENLNSSLYSVAADNYDVFTLNYLVQNNIEIDHTILDTAITHGDLTLVYFLCSLGFHTDDCLTLAIQRQNISIVKALLATQENVVNQRGEDSLHWAPIHAAVSLNDLDIVKILTSNEETDINIQDDDGNTPLSIAVSNEFTDIINHLMSLPKIDQDIADNKGWTPLAIAVGNGLQNIVSILLNDRLTNVNCKTEDNTTPIMIAADTGNFDIFKMLLQRPDINVNAKANNETALTISIRKELTPFVEALISTKKLDLSLGNPVQLAHESKNKEIQQIILDYADVINQMK